MDTAPTVTSDHEGGRQVLNRGAVVAVAELEQVAKGLTSEVLSGELPSMELAVDHGEGEGEQGTEGLGLGHGLGRLN